MGPHLVSTRLTAVRLWGTHCCKASVLLSSGETSQPPERAAIAAAFLPAYASTVHSKKSGSLLAARPRIAPGDPGCPGGLQHHPSKHVPSEVPPRAPALRLAPHCITPPAISTCTRSTHKGEESLRSRMVAEGYLCENTARFRVSSQVSGAVAR